MTVIYIFEVENNIVMGLEGAELSGWTRHLGGFASHSAEVIDAIFVRSVHIVLRGGPQQMAQLQSQNFSPMELERWLARYIGCFDVTGIMQDGRFFAIFQGQDKKSNHHVWECVAT